MCKDIYLFYSNERMCDIEVLMQLLFGYKEDYNFDQYTHGYFICPLKTRDNNKIGAFEKNSYIGRKIDAGENYNYIEIKDKQLFIEEIIKLYGNCNF